MIDLNRVVALKIEKQENNQYKVSAYKNYPEFLELELKVFETIEETWEDDSNIVEYINSLQVKYSYPYQVPNT